MSALIARSPGAHCTRVVVGTSHTLEKVKDESRTRSQVDVIMGYNEMREVSFGEMRKIQIITLPVNEPGSHWWLIVIYPLTQKSHLLTLLLGLSGRKEYKKEPKRRDGTTSFFGMKRKQRRRKASPRSTRQGERLKRQNGRGKATDQAAEYLLSWR
jgi:hypothetical protein